MSKRNSNYVSKEEWGKRWDEIRNRFHTTPTHILSCQLTELRSKYMKSTAWKEFREEVLTQQNQCEICAKLGEDNILNLHHIEYETIGREQLSDLMVLYQRCHINYHDILKEGTFEGDISKSLYYKVLEERNYISYYDREISG